ncbi:organomercurial lyase [Streptomyces mirabilis]|uniref:organomercurial lyase n=1 Tax=Streptomyces mirabilis TaxID=68239 RepID=UPI0033AD40C6
MTRLRQHRAAATHCDKRRHVCFGTDASASRGRRLLGLPAVPVTPAGLAQGDPGRGFPAVLGHTAQVTSPCRATGDPVRLTATPDGPTNVEPTIAVVSVVTPDAPTMVRVLLQPIPLLRWRRRGRRRQPGAGWTSAPAPGSCPSPTASNAPSSRRSAPAPPRPAAAERRPGW